MMALRDVGILSFCLYKYDIVIPLSWTANPSLSRISRGKSRSALGAEVVRRLIQGRMISELAFRLTQIKLVPYDKPRPRAYRNASATLPTVRLGRLHRLGSTLPKNCP